MPQWYLNLRGSILLLQSAVGVMLFCYSLKRRERFGLRVLLGLTAGCVLSRAAGYFYIPGQGTLAVLSHGMMPLFTYLVLIGVVYFCFDETIWTALFAASSGYIAQDLAGSFKQILKLFPATAPLATDNFGVLALDLICYGLTFQLLFRLFRPVTQNRTDDFDNRLKAVASAVVLVLCIGMARMTQDNPDRNAMAAVAESMYSILLDLMMLGLQFGIIEHAKLRTQVETMQELMHQQYMQFETSKESVELINEKYHDLKHLLTGFRDVVPEKQLDQLSKTIERYDVRVSTGYEVLDVLLTQKMDLCLQRGITMTCALGNTDFGFMEDMDLYALFQNAVNNAINAASELPDGAAKFVLVTAQQDGNLVTLHVENSCGTDVRFEDGLPQTAQDPRYHGFGVRSMARTAERYGGMLAVKQQDGRFLLDVLLTDERK